MDDLEKMDSEQDVQPGTLGRMASLFASQTAAFSYLSFVLLYAPCVAVVGAMVRESGTLWAALDFSWATWVAYFVALWIYQLANLIAMPALALGYLGGSLLLMLLAIHLLKRLAPKLHDKETIPLLNL